MRWRCIIALIALSSVSASPAIAEVSQVERHSHLSLLWGYSLHADINEYVAGNEYNFDADGPVSPHGPLLLGWTGLPFNDRLIVGARVLLLPGGVGLGVSVAMSFGVRLLHRPWLELVLLPAVGMMAYPNRSLVAAFGAARRGPVLSLGLAAAIPMVGRLETILYCAFDMLPAQPIPTMDIGFDAVAGIGLGFAL